MRSSALARTRTRQASTQGEELRNWREGLEHALRAPARRRRPLRLLAISLVMLIVAGGVFAYSYAHVIGGLFARTKVALHPTSGKVLNMLLVGSDSRQGLNNAADIARFGVVGGQRSDTIIIAQLIPSEQRGVLLHLPRDLWVPVHENGRVFNAKINSSYQYGPQAVIDTVQALTGIPINHYLEVNIAGFRSMVDAIGGIDICMDRRLYDSKLNFLLPAGTSHLDGNTALSFVRSRYSTPDGDFGRIKRQQQFIRAVITKVGQPSVLGNPLRVNNLARAFAKNIRVDQFFQLNDLVRFAVSVHRVGVDQLQTLSAPANVGYTDGQSVDFIDAQRASPIFEALQKGEKPVTATTATPASPTRTTATPGHTVAAASPCARPAAG